MRSPSKLHRISPFGLMLGSPISFIFAAGDRFPDSLNHCWRSRSSKATDSTLKVVVLPPQSEHFSPDVAPVQILMVLNELVLCLQVVRSLRDELRAQGPRVMLTYLQGLRPVVFATVLRRGKGLLKACDEVLHRLETCQVRQLPTENLRQRSPVQGTTAAVPACKQHRQQNSLCTHSTAPARLL